MKNRYIFTGNRTLAHQRGAIGVLGALVLALGVLFMALSVDSGRLYLEQQRLQKVADMAALDASRSAGSCGDATVATAQAAGQAANGRNGFLGNLLTNAGSVSDALDDLTGAGPDAVTEVGTIALGAVRTGADGIRTFDPTAPAAASAVQVTAASRVPASLVAGGIFGGTVDLSAVAVAEREAVAGLSAGSFLARLDTTNSPILNALLGDILGSSLSLDLVAWTGIAATKVNLLNLLAAQAAVGTVDELLDADLTLSELLSLTATAVNDSGTASAAVNSALGPIASAAVANLPVRLGDVIDVQSPVSDAAAEAQISVLDLITTAALVANGQNAIALPLRINLPGGLLNVQADLRIIEPPQIAIGPPGRDENGEWRTHVETAQIRLDVRITSNVNILVLTANVDLNLQLRVAQGSAWLASIDCGSLRGPSQVTVGAQPGIASLRITRSPTNPQPAKITVKTLLGISVADVDVGLNLPLQDPDSTDLVYTVGDAGDLPQMKTASSTLGGSLGNGLQNLANSLVLDVDLLGLTGRLLGLGGILRPLVGNLLAPALSQIASGLLDPVLTLLGIKAGGLDVQLFELNEKRPELLI